MGRAPCCEQNGLKKGPWTPEEDKKLVDFIQTHGHGSWRTLPNNAGLQRCGKSCRLRWTNYLRPDIKRGRFSSEEEEMIIQLHSVIGNKWSAIAARLPGRTDNEIKNYWNTHIRKRLLRMGIDPVTHTPRFDFLNISSLLNSSQLDVSGFLGMEPAVNPDVLRLATYLLSSQHENQEFTPKNVQENQLQDSQIDNHFHVQSTQLQTPSQEYVSCPTSNICGPFVNAIMQPYADESLSIPIDLEPMENYVPQLDYDYVDQSLLEHLYGRTNFVSKEYVTPQNVAFSSGLSTPTSSPVTTLNSSLTNGNSNIEDERDTYCSDYMFEFEVPRIMNVNNFM